MQNSFNHTQPAGRRIGATLSTTVLSGALLASMAHGQAPAFVKETQDSLPGFNIHRPADLATRTKPAGVFVWANGGCATRDGRWTPMFEKWASNGYVVLSINEPGSPEPGGGRPPGPGGGGPPGGGPPGGRPPGGGAPGAAPGGGGGMNAQGTVDKQKKAIDWVEQQTASKGGLYSGKLDMTHIVVGGNSCGGISSIQLSAQDNRPDAIFVLTGSSLGPNADKAATEALMSKVHIPVLYVVGGTEDIARAAATMDYEALPKGVPAAIIGRATGNHGTISGADPTVLPIAADIALLWFKAALDKDRAAANTLKTKICDACDPQVWPTNMNKNF